MTLRQFLTIVGFEVRLQFQGIGVPIVGLAMMLMSLVYSNSTEYLIDVGALDLPRNAPYLVYVFTSTPAFVFLFFLAHLASSPLVRDLKHRMAETIHSHPFSNRGYLIAKWTATMLTAHLIGACIPLAFALLPLLGRIGLYPPDLLGPTPWAHLAHAYVYFVSPMILGLGSLYFGLTLWTGRSAAAFGASFGAALVWMFAFVLLWEGGVNKPLAVVLDPIGYTGVVHQSLQWSHQQKMTMFLAWDGPAVANRVLWIGLGALVLATGLWRGRLQQLLHVADLRGGNRAKSRAPSPGTATFVAYARTGSTAGVLFSATGEALGTFLKSRLLHALWPLSVLVGILSTYTHVLQGPDGEKWPWLGLVWPLAYAHNIVMSLFYLVWLSGHWARRERDHGMDAMIESLPVTNAVLLWPRLVVLAFAALLFAAVPTISSFVLSLAIAPETFRPVEGLLALLTVSWPGFWSIVWLTFAVYGLVTNRWLGHFLAFGVLFCCVMNTELGLVENEIWRFGLVGAPEVGAFEGATMASAWLRPALVGSWFVLLSGLLAGGTILLWPRGNTSFMERVARSFRGLRPGVASAAWGLSVVLATLAWITLRSGFEDGGTLAKDQERAEMAAYERAFLPPAPGEASAEIVDARVRLDFRSDPGKVVSRSEFRLVLPAAGGTYGFDLPETVREVRWRAGSERLRTRHDADLRRLRLDWAVGPRSDTLSLVVDLVQEFRGFLADGRPRPDLEGSFWLDGEDLLVLPGLRRSRLLQEPTLRIRHGLDSAVPELARLADDRSDDRFPFSLEVLAPLHSGLLVSYLGFVPADRRERRDLAEPYDLAVATVAEPPTFRTPQWSVWAGPHQQWASATSTAFAEALPHLSGLLGPPAHGTWNVAFVPRGTMESGLRGDLLVLSEEDYLERSPADAPQGRHLFDVTRHLAAHWLRDRSGLRSLPGQILVHQGFAEALAADLQLRKHGLEALHTTLESRTREFQEHFPLLATSFQAPGSAILEHPAMEAASFYAAHVLVQSLGADTVGHRLREGLARSGGHPDSAILGLAALDTAWAERFVRRSTWFEFASDRPSVGSQGAGAGTRIPVRRRAFEAIGRELVEVAPPSMPLEWATSDDSLRFISPTETSIVVLPGVDRIRVNPRQRLPERFLSPSPRTIPVR